MQRLLLFPCIVMLAALAGCSQSVVEPLSQQPVVNIDDYFWKLGQTPLIFMDSSQSPGVSYKLTFASPRDTLTVKDAMSADSFQCIINRDSIYAFDYGLSRNSVFDAGNDSKFYEGLVLLRSNPFGNDSSWAAGTLWIKSTHSYLFTARALAHFDTLQVATSDTGNHSAGAYSDVLMVQYKFEGTNTYSSQDTIPYWVIYYAKNMGPVMIDKVMITQTVPPKQTSFDRHEIAQ